MGKFVRVAAIAAAFLLLAAAAPAEASTTASARIADRYDHGRVKVFVNGVTHTLRHGERTGMFTIKPSRSHNDGVSVTSLRYPGCGEGSAGWYFRTGHRYRIVIKSSTDRCSVGGGKYVPGPVFVINKIS